MKAKYDKAETNINKICKVMEGHQITLLKDAAMLDKMYELNLNYFKELSMAACTILEDHLGIGDIDLRRKVIDHFLLFRR